MTGLDYFKKVWINYAEFDGRARRSEYWYYVLFLMLAFLLLGFFSAVIGGLFGENAAFLGMIPIGLLGLASIIPSIAVAVRRLHDTGRNRWWYLVTFIPAVGGFILLILMCLDGEIGSNQYGPDPKAVEAGGVADHLIEDELV